MPLRASPKTKSGLAWIEPLEQRQMLAVFANGIDSENMGKGIWAWNLRNAMTNAGFTYPSQISQFMTFEKNTQGMQYLITKAGDGANVYNNGSGQNYTTTVVNAARAAGLKILPYFYIFGGALPATKGTLQGEIDVFKRFMDPKLADGVTNNPNFVGGDGVVLDIEGEYAGAEGGPTTAIVNYMNGIGKSQAGDGSGVRDNLFIAYSTFPYVHFHNTEVPFLQLGDYCDASMPQAYWSEWNTVPNGTRSRYDGQTMTPTVMIDDVHSEYAMKSFETPARTNIWNGRPESIKPIIITGMTYNGGGNSTTAAEITEFIDAAKISTTIPIPGPTGVNTFQSFGYRGINFFDENSTDPAERAALAAATVGVLPGAPASPTPADAASLSSSPVTLDCADVITTSTTGAATSYDVYLDGVFKANVTTSQYAVSTALAAGAHNWQVRPKSIIGTTTGPTWTFTVTPAVVNAPSGLNVTSFAHNSVSLAWTDNSNNESQFLIERRTGAGGSYAQINTAVANATSFTDNTAQPNTAYYYRVRAWDGNTVYSSYSNTLIVTTLAATPTGLAASDGLFNNRVALAWSAAAGAAKYRVYRSATSNSQDAIAIADPLTTTYDDIPPNPNATYYYWVAGLNNANVPSALSAVESGFFDTIAPNHASRNFQAQFSPLYVSFSFNEPVTGIDLSDLTLASADTPAGSLPTATSWSYISASNTIRFLLDSATHPDGNFTATVSGITDLAGNAPPPGAAHPFSFLRGDASGDGKVNALDFNALASHFGFIGAGFSGGDFNFDNEVTSLDFTALALRFNTSLPSPAPFALAVLRVQGLFGQVAVEEDDTAIFAMENPSPLL